MSDMDETRKLLDEAIPAPPGTEGWAAAAAGASRRRRHLAAGAAGALVLVLGVPVVVSLSQGRVPIATPVETTAVSPRTTASPVPVPTVGTEGTAAASYHVRGTAWTIRQGPDDKLPVACMSGSTEGHPPRCADQLPLRGMTWDDIEYQEVDGVRFSDRGYDLEGDYVPQRGTAGVLTLNTPPVPFVVPTDTEGPDPTPSPKGPGPACADPYVDANSGGADDSDRSEIDLHLMKRSDVVEFMSVSAEPGGLAFNVVVNSDADRVFAELRKLWGGGLCVSYEDAPSRSELWAVYNEIRDEVTAPGEFGPVVDGQGEDRAVDIRVYLNTPELDKQIRDAAGDGIVVRIESVLTLVE